MEAKEENKEVQLFASVDEYEVNQVCAILKENNIPFIKRTDGSGAYMNLYMGQSIQEKRIFVSENDYKKSVELISTFISNHEETDETCEQGEEDDSNKKYIAIKRAWVWLMIGLPIFVIILSIMAIICS